MIAGSIVSSDVPKIGFHNTVKEVLDYMALNFMRQVPFFKNDGVCIGVITEDELLNYNEYDILKDIDLNLIRVFSSYNDHFLEVIERMSKYGLSLIPVLSKEEKYIGCIRLEDLFTFLSSQYTFADKGGIIVLETNKSDYSLSDLARIVESEGAHIIGNYLSSVVNSTLILVTLKINILDLSRIVATLERYGYTIRASFNEDGYFDSLKDRYDSLMSFLNV